MLNTLWWGKGVILAIYLGKKKGEKCIKNRGTQLNSALFGDINAKTFRGGADFAPPPSPFPSREGFAPSDTSVFTGGKN